MGGLSITGVDLAPAAGTDRQRRLELVARQFETVFVNELLRQSHDPFGNGPLSGEEDSSAEKQFAQLLDQGLAERAAGGLGIAAMMVRQLSGRAHGGDR